MALHNGTKLGSCKILAHIGAGKMGEVSLAMDIMLHREEVRVLGEHKARTIIS